MCIRDRYERCADMAEYIVSADTVSGCFTGNNCYYQKKGLFQMKNVIFQIKYDFINGIVHQWKKFLLIAVVYAVLITDSVSYTHLSASGVGYCRCRRISYDQFSA